MLKILANRFMGKQKNKKGFSIAEVSLALFVMTVGIVFVIDLISQNTRSSIETRNHVIAAQLAQEGVELVRNIRDNNRLSSRPVFQYFPFNVAGASFSCRIDKDYQYQTVGEVYNNAFDINCSNTDYSLKYDANSFYIHGTGAPGQENTKFSRKLIITVDVANLDVRNIKSIVVWNRSDFPDLVSTLCSAKEKCTMSEEVISNWQ